MKTLSKFISCMAVMAVAIVSTCPIVSASYQNKYDLNEDGCNDITDLTYFSLYLCGESEPNNLSKYDFNNNKIISYRDYLEIRNFVLYPSM